jgi:hypothetical protein
LLLLIETVVATFDRHQFIVGPLFHYGTLVHDHNYIRIPNRAEAMGDEEDTPAPEDFDKVLANLTLRVVVQCAGGLV